MACKLLVATCRSSSLTRDRTRAPCIGKCSVLATGPPGKSLKYSLKSTQANLAEHPRVGWEDSHGYRGRGGKLPVKGLWGGAAVLGMGLWWLVQARARAREDCDPQTQAHRLLLEAPPQVRLNAAA